MPTILYLHGFLSSPQSEKVRILREAIEKENKSRAEDEQIKLIAPDLNHPPRCVDTLLSDWFEPRGLLGNTLCQALWRKSGAFESLF